MGQKIQNDTYVYQSEQPLEFDDEIPTGKYKGETVRSVYMIDPHYLLWAASDNALIFDEEVLQTLESF